MASWNEELAEELHKPVRHKFTRRNVLINGIDDVWSCDLVEMQEWSKENEGYRYMLNVIDVFSKYAWSIPLKDKRAKTVLDAFEKIVSESKRKPKHIWVDEGKEFYNKYIDEVTTENDIVRYSTHGEHKSAVVERFNRTLKTNMWKRFTAENTRNWINMLDKLLRDYNNKVHSTIKMTPVKASLKENEVTVWNNINRNVKLATNKELFQIGDTVRISRTKGIFEKGYLPNWSEELFTIFEVKKSNPPTYNLKDTLGEVISGSVYNEELVNRRFIELKKLFVKRKLTALNTDLLSGLGIALSLMSGYQ